MSTKADRNAERSWRPSLLSDEDVAYELRCSPSYVRQLHAEGRLPAVKLGKLTLWEPATVDAFIAALPADPNNVPTPMLVGVRKSNAGRRSKPQAQARQESHVG